MVHDMDEISEGIDFPVCAIGETGGKNGFAVIDCRGRAVSDGLTKRESAFVADAINRFVGVACKEFVEDQLMRKAKECVRHGRV